MIIKMLSKQINFFSLESDLDLFFDFFKSHNILVYPYKIKDLNEVKRLDGISTIKNHSRVELLSEIFTNRLNYKHIVKQSHFICDSESSYVIEFAFSGTSGQGYISPGRLYFTQRFLEKETFFLKDGQFILWAQSVFKKFKKEFLIKNSKTNEWYVSKAINEQLNEENIQWVNNSNSLLVISDLSQPTVRNVPRLH